MEKREKIHVWTAKDLSSGAYKKVRHLQVDEDLSTNAETLEFLVKFYEEHQDGK